MRLFKKAGMTVLALAAMLMAIALFPFAVVWMFTLMSWFSGLLPWPTR